MGARKNCMIDEVVVEYAYSIFADKGAANASLADTSPFPTVKCRLNIGAGASVR